VVGTLTVRARAGVNRIRFRGRFRGRPLPAGGYRLIVRTRGAARPAAAVPIVVTHGSVNPAALRRAKSIVGCSDLLAESGEADSSAAATGGGHEASGLLATVKRVKAPLASAAKALARTAGDVAGRVKGASGEAPNDPFLLTLVGVVALVSAILGGAMLVQQVRAARDRRYYY
jgi:hypothetical protein